MVTRNVVLVILPFAVAIALSVGFLLIFRQRAAYIEEMRRRDRLAEPDLATWRERCRAWVAAGLEVYAYFKHEDAGRGPAYAQALLGGA